MYTEKADILFNTDWLLAHKLQYDGDPVAWVAKRLDEEMQDVTLRYNAFAIFCTVTMTEPMQADTLREMFVCFLMEKLNEESLRGVAIVLVHSAEELSDEEPVSYDGEDEEPEVGFYEDRDVEEAEDAEDEEDEASEDVDGESGADSPSSERGEGTQQPPAEGEKKAEGAPAAETSSPFAQLAARLKKLRTALHEKIAGQDHAIDAFVSAVFNMEADVRPKGARSRPRAVCLFAGPPGVGKTFLAETAAAALRRPFLRLDMSAYSDDEISLASFHGVNRSYKESKPGIVTSFVKSNPKCVLLFDEIEKAHPLIIQLFLQILEGGRCRDFHYDEEISFKDTVIILTTNAGRNLYEDTGKRYFADVTTEMIVNALRTDINPANKRPFFPTPILSRLAEGSIILFNYLDAAALCRIIRQTMDEAVENLSSRVGLEVECSDELAAAVLFSAGGSADARTLKGKARSLVNDEVLEMLRQIGSSGREELYDTLRRVRISLDLSDAAKEARALFEQNKRLRVLLFCADAVELPEGEDSFRLVRTSDLARAKALLRGGADIVVADPLCNRRDRGYSPSDPEDLLSDGNELFRYAREYHEDLPLYILDRRAAGEDFYRSYLRAGALGTVPFDPSAPQEIIRALGACCASARICMQAEKLMRSHRLLAYNAAQIFSEDGKSAEIRLASLCLRRNVSAEDSAHILAENLRPDVHFSDVIGAAEAKEALRGFIDYLKDPRGDLRRGTRAPRGVLLYGAPGTGKTLLARAVAGESGVTFIQKNATEFFKSMVGEGPGAVREVFRIARKYAPTVLFVDEIDAIGRMRTGGESVHAAEELQNTFLSELDGFAFDEKRPVFLLAATNYDIDAQGGGQRVLDPAFVRRFDRSVKIELPNTEERRQFLQYYLKKHGIRGIREETLDSLAARSIGRSPADLERVIQYALRKRKGKRLTDRDLTLALDAERYGKEREWSEEVMRKTSLHEAGHAVVSWLCGEVPEYLTNISRGDFGGYMQRKTEDGRFGYTRQELCDRICCSLAGRAAEGEFYGDEGVTTGASGDLERASELARAIVCRLGMAEDGDLLVLSAEEETEEVRSRIRSLLRAQAERAALLVRENRDAVESLAEELLKKNSLTHAELAAFFEARQKNI